MTRLFPHQHLHSPLHHATRGQQPPHLPSLPTFLEGQRTGDEGSRCQGCCQHTHAGGQGAQRPAEFVQQPWAQQRCYICFLLSPCYLLSTQFVPTVLFLLSTPCLKLSSHVASLVLGKGWADTQHTDCFSLSISLANGATAAGSQRAACTRAAFWLRQNLSPQVANWPKPSVKITLLKSTDFHALGTEKAISAQHALSIKHPARRQLRGSARLSTRHL